MIILSIFRLFFFFALLFVGLALGLGILLALRLRLGMRHSPMRDWKPEGHYHAPDGSKVIEGEYTVIEEQRPEQKWGC